MSGNGGPARVDRCRGAVVGTALGDALGAPFEGRSQVQPVEVSRWADAAAALRWTDDTHMTIGVAESLIACDGFDPTHMARRFAANHAVEPWRGYGPGPPQVFEALRRGAAWDEPATTLFEGQGSLGNGAAMRVAPIGLVASGCPDRAAMIARESARITHAHPVGRDGAAVQAFAIAWLASASPPLTPAMAAGLLDELQVTAATSALRDKLACLPELLSIASAPSAVRALGNGLRADEAVPAALYAFLTHPHSSDSAVVAAVELGGDTDTIAAMTGALTGALHGAGGFPAPWRARLEAADRLRELADRLADVSVCHD